MFRNSLYLLLEKKALCKDGPTGIRNTTESATMGHATTTENKETHQLSKKFGKMRRFLKLKSFLGHLFLPLCRLSVLSFMEGPFQMRNPPLQISFSLSDAPTLKAMVQLLFCLNLHTIMQCFLCMSSDTFPTCV